MKRHAFVILGFVASCSAYSAASAQDTSARLFNVYAESVINPDSFDNYVARNSFDSRLRSCIGDLSAAYAPIVQQHLNYCGSIADWQAKKNCMNQAPPKVHVGDWLGSLQLKLNGAPWCDTSAGWSACNGKRMVGPGFWRDTVRSFFPIWKQYLRC